MHPELVHRQMTAVWCRSHAAENFEVHPTKQLAFLDADADQFSSIGYMASSMVQVERILVHASELVLQMVPPPLEQQSHNV